MRNKEKNKINNLEIDKKRKGNKEKKQRKEIDEIVTEIPFSFHS